MINLDDLKPILQEIISEENMADAILRVSEIDHDMDTSALDEANATIEKLREQNKKLTDIFFTGKNEKFDDAPLPDDGVDGDDEEDNIPQTFDDLFKEE